MNAKKAGFGYGTRLAVLLIALVVVAIPAARGAAAETKPANWDSDYMWGSSNCTDEADPINLMFYKAGYRALSKVEQNLGWTLIEGGTMYVRDFGDCFPSALRGGFQQRK